MILLTKSEMQTVISDNIADYNKEICIFKCIKSGAHKIFYYSLVDGLYVSDFIPESFVEGWSDGYLLYQPQPFNVKDVEWSDEFTYFDFELHKDRGVVIIDGEVNRDDIIAIARHLKVSPWEL